MTVFPAPMPAEQARAVLRLLAEFGLIRIGRDGDSYGPVQAATELLDLLERRAEATDEHRRALLDQLVALFASRPALWSGHLADQVRRLLTVLLEQSDLRRADRSDTYLDVLHTLATTPDGLTAAELDGVGLDGAEWVVQVLRTPGLVRNAGPEHDHYRVWLPIRRLLGDLANPGEIDAPEYPRELHTLRRLLDRVPDPADLTRALTGLAGELAESLERLRAIEGSALHRDAERGPLWEPAPTSYGAILLAVRDTPGINTTDLATRLGVPQEYALSSARRLARLGLVQLTHRAVGGEYYLLRTGVAELITALEDPGHNTGAYRAALLDLAELLMRELRDRPSLSGLAAAVAPLRELAESPLEATARVDVLYEPPVVSYLDLLVAIGASPGSGAFEIAKLLSTTPEFARGDLVLRMAPGLVTYTRRVMNWKGRYLVVTPEGSTWAEPEYTSYQRTKFLFELTELGQAFLSALRDPEAVPGPRDRAALHRAALLLRRNPGHRDRISIDALVDAIVRLLSPAEPTAPAEPTEDAPPTRQMSLRGLLALVAAQDRFRTSAELGVHDGALKRRLARLADWGLLERDYAADHTPRYRMPEHPRQLLHDMDYRATVADR